MGWLLVAAANIIKLCFIITDAENVYSWNFIMLALYWHWNQYKSKTLL